MAMGRPHDFFYGVGPLALLGVRPSPLHGLGRSHGRKRCFRQVRAHPPVRVGHRQAFNLRSRSRKTAAFLLSGETSLLFDV